MPRISTVEDFEFLVKQVTLRTNLSDQFSQDLILHIARALDAPLQLSAQERASVKSFLDQNLTIESWLSYNSSQELAFALTFPKLYSLYRQKQAAVAALSLAEQGALDAAQ